MKTATPQSAGESSKRYYRALAHAINEELNDAIPIGMIFLGKDDQVPCGLCHDIFLDVFSQTGHPVRVQMNGGATQENLIAHATFARNITHPDEQARGIFIAFNAKSEEKIAVRRYGPNGKTLPNGITDQIQQKVRELLNEQSVSPNDCDTTTVPAVRKIEETDFCNDYLYGITGPFHLVCHHRALKSDKKGASL